MATGSDDVDLLLLDHVRPVARGRALTRGVALYEDRPGAYADAQPAAIGERMDTDGPPRLDLERSGP